MALGTGSIRFSQIVSEFGGVSPHRFSEYYALNGLGVSGIPASGLMRFSNFRGKSNQVTTSVWVSSGYNSTSWVNRGRHPSYHFGNNNTGHYVYYGNGADYRYAYSYYSSWIRLWNSWSVKWQSNNGNTTNWWADYATPVTTWVDTSSYQDQTTTAQIST